MAKDPENNRRTTFFGVIWRHKLLLLLCAVVVIAVGAYVVYEQHSAYRSDMQLLILRRGPSANAAQPGNAPGQVFLEDYVPTHQTLIRSQMILSRTLKQLNGNVPHTIPPGSKDGLGILGSNLKVTREGKDANNPDNNVLNVSFTGPDPEEAKIILETLKAEYDAELVETYQSLNARYLKDLTNQKEAAEKTLHDLMLKEAEIAKKQPLVAQNLEAAQAVNNRLQQATRDYQDIKKAVTNLQLDITFWENLIADAEKKNKPRSDLIKLLPKEFYSPETKNNDPDKKSDPESDPISAYLHHLKLSKAKQEEALKAANHTLASAQEEANEVGTFLADLRTARTALQQSQMTVDNLRIRIAAVKSVNMDVGFNLRTIAEPQTGRKTSLIPEIFIPSMGGSLNFIAGVALGIFTGIGLAACVVWLGRTSRTTT